VQLVLYEYSNAGLFPLTAVSYPGVTHFDN